MLFIVSEPNQATFSKAMIQRTIRELSQLGYFDQQQIGVNLRIFKQERWIWNIQ